MYVNKLYKNQIYVKREVDVIIIGHTQSHFVPVVTRRNITSYVERELLADNLCVPVVI